jgi:hypothetical protein
MKEYEKLAEDYEKTAIYGVCSYSFEDVNTAYQAGFLKCREMAVEIWTNNNSTTPPL